MARNNNDIFKGLPFHLSYLYILFLNSFFLFIFDNLFSVQVIPSKVTEQPTPTVTNSAHVMLTTILRQAIAQWHVKEPGGTTCARGPI